MNKPILIGVGFRKQQGKDVFSDMLAKHLFKRGAIVHRDSWAADLKDEVEASGVPRHLIDGDEEARATLVPHPITGEPVTVRYLLQWWGTEYRRAQDPYYWIKSLTSRYPSNAVRRPEFVVISDCRFPNELEVVDRSFAVRRHGRFEPDAHSSENSVDYPDFDRIVENDSNLACLDLTAEIVAKHLVEHTPLPF